MGLLNKNKSAAGVTPPTFLTTPPMWGIDALAGPVRKRTKVFTSWYQADNPSKKYERRSHDWGFAAGALYKMFNGGAWNSFEYTDRDKLATTLRSSWGMNRRNDLLSSVYWLLTEGHRHDFQHHVSYTAGLEPQAYAEIDARLEAQGVDSEFRWQLRQARTNAYGVRGTDFAAWDLVRLIFLCTAGTHIGYITYEEGLDAMALVQGELQARYPDWQALGRDFAVARWFWSGGEDQRMVDSLAAVNVLLSKGAAWQIVPYDLPQPPRDGSIVRALAGSGIVVPLTDAERENANPWQRRIDDMVRSNGHGGFDPPGTADLSPIEIGEPKRLVKYGATAVDLRDGPYRTQPPTGEMGWLISLAAPFIESHALYHDGVSPIPAGDAAWHAHLDAVWPGLARVTDWETALMPPTEAGMTGRHDDRQPPLPDAARRALTVAQYAFACRVAVAIGKLEEADALDRIRTAAALIESRFESWTEYAAALGIAIGGDKGPNNTVYRVVLSDLLDPGLPWGDVAWLSP